MLHFPHSRYVPRRWKACHRNLFLRLSSFMALTLVTAILLAPLNFTVSAFENRAKPSPIKVTTAQLLDDGHVYTEKPTAARSHIDSFIIEVKNGVSTCREATSEEILSTLPRDDDSRTPIKINYLPESQANLVSPGGENVSGPLTINLVALSQLDTDPNKATIIAAFQRAAAIWTARIKSPTTVTLNVDYGVNKPDGTAWGSSSVLGSTSSRAVQIDYPGFRTNLNASASSPAEASIYSALPVSFVPTDTGNGGVTVVSRTVARQLGIPASTTPIDDATISFNKNFAFDFNPDDGITSNTTDFVAVATHEIGHALGFTSGAGQGLTSQVRNWDVFRFRTGTTPSTFTTAQRIMSIGGGAQVYYTGQTFQTFTVPTQFSPATPNGTTLEPALSTGGPSGVITNGGDGQQSSHWKADEQSGIFIGIMDPTISKGVRMDPTENDFSALETIGWDLTGNAQIPGPPPPPPNPPNDNFANAQALSGCSGSVTGTNVGATKEVGEPNNTDSPNSTRSVWYRWQSPSNGAVTIDTIGSGFDTVLEVYTGSTLTGLTSIEHNDDNEDPNTTEHEVSSLVTFTATQGITYSILVNGFNNQGSGGDIGSIKLNWTQTNCTAGGPTIFVEQGTNVLAAVDSVTQVKGPFTVLTPNNFSSDGRRRIIFFTSDLGLAAGNTTGLIVRANTTSLPVETAGPFTAINGSYVIIRLDTLTPGTYNLTVELNGANSTNAPTIQIIP